MIMCVMHAVHVIHTILPNLAMAVSWDSQEPSCPKVHLKTSLVKHIFLLSFPLHYHHFVSQMTTIAALSIQLLLGSEIGGEVTWKLLSALEDSSHK